VRLTAFLARLVVSTSQFANKHGVYLGRCSSKIHVALYRNSGGKFGGYVPGWPAARILLLEHTGARSGVRRVSPLIYYEEGGVVAVAASKGGQPTHPAWFHNLIAHPETRTQVGARTRSVARAHFQRPTRHASCSSSRRLLVDSSTDLASDR
jgi:deazaflavin-dependent oxidoreductase (nitroreductase family)